MMPKCTGMCDIHCSMSHLNEREMLYSPCSYQLPMAPYLGADPQRPSSPKLQFCLASSCADLTQVRPRGYDEMNIHTMFRNFPESWVVVVG